MLEKYKTKSILINIFKTSGRYRKRIVDGNDTPETRESYCRVVEGQRNEKGQNDVRTDRNYSVRGKLKALFTSATNLTEEFMARCRSSIRFIRSVLM